MFPIVQFFDLSSFVAVLVPFPFPAEDSLFGRAGPSDQWTSGSSLFVTATEASVKAEALVVELKAMATAAAAAAVSPPPFSLDSFCTKSRLYHLPHPLPPTSPHTYM